MLRVQPTEGVRQVELVNLYRGMQLQAGNNKNGIGIAKHTAVFLGPATHHRP